MSEDSSVQQLDSDVVMLGFGFERGDRITNDSQALAGSLVVDADGNVYRVYSHRHHTLKVHPVVDGRPVVSADTTIRWWTQADPNLMAPGENDRRTPIYEMSDREADE